ncbi:hypothetical protein NQ315_009594 [Exocentrus adspersus]|uniref:Uncharacterized protein n=1 Tax=Exocentrus adspersus TaxID=1586481 RepID=A0AAV8WHN5_9CUCU|nr:hypothetical protein NQ315_009594 [Exocentrus adspersus]
MKKEVSMEVNQLGFIVFVTSLHTFIRVLHLEREASVASHPNKKSEERFPVERDISVENAVHHSSNVFTSYKETDGTYFAPEKRKLVKFRSRQELHCLFQKRPSGKSGLPGKRAVKIYKRKWKIMKQKWPEPNFNLLICQPLTMR